MVIGMDFECDVLGFVPAGSIMFTQKLPTWGYRDSLCLHLIITDNLITRNNPPSPLLLIFFFLGGGGAVFLFCFFSQQSSDQIFDPQHAWNVFRWVQL